jgi:hypothetical protein
LNFCEDLADFTRTSFAHVAESFGEEDEDDAWHISAIVRAINVKSKIGRYERWLSRKECRVDHDSSL